MLGRESNSTPVAVHDIATRQVLEDLDGPSAKTGHRSAISMGNITKCTYVPLRF